MKNTCDRLRRLSALTVSTLLLVQTLPAANILWNGSGDKLWSTSGNWTGGTPGIANVAIFASSGATNNPGVDNTVSVSVTNQGVAYQTNTVGYHHTFINSGITLGITNLTTGVAQGIQVGLDNVFNGKVTNTISGLDGKLFMAGNLIGANSIGFQVRQCASPAAPEQVVLDMSGLGTLVATIGKLGVAQGGTALGQSNVSARLNLARTNIITLLRPNATQCVLGDSSGSAFTLPASTLNLGITNAFFIENLSVGKQKATNIVFRFNPAFTNLSPALYMRNTNGAPSPRVTFWNFADVNTEATTPAQVSATIDFNNGTLDAQVEALLLGQGSTNTSDSGFANGTLTFSGGTLDANNIKLGVQRAVNSGSVSAVLNVNGTATLVTTNIELARITGGAGAAQTASTLNINGGTVKVSGNIASFGGQSTNNLNSGLIDMKPAGAATSGNISLIALNMGANGAAAITNAGIIAVSNSLTIAANGRIDGASTTVILPSGATLRGNGNINAPTTINSGATIQPGLTANDTTTLNVNSILDLVGTTVMALNRTNAQNSSRIAGVTSLTNGGTITVTNIGPALQSWDTFTLLSATTRTGTFSTTTLPTLGADLSWVDNLATSGTLQVQPGAATALTVETAADGSGTFVSAQNILLGGTKTVYAILRDSSGNFVSNAPVTWSLINKTGGVADGDLAPTTGTSATFTGNSLGSAQVHADYNTGTFTADSGVLTVITSIDHYDVAVSSPQTAGDVFVVTVTAKDTGNNTVDDSTTTVTLTSNGSLQVDADNNSTFGDTSLVLVHGVAAFHAKDNKAETINVTATDTGTQTGTFSNLVINAGAATRLIVTLPGQTFAPFTGNSGSVTTQAVGVAFNLVSLSAVDNFNNVDPNYTAGHTIAYSGPGGSPSYTTSVSFTAGQSTTTLSTTLLKAETTTISATDGSLIGVPSSSLVVAAGAFTKLQLVLPGETAAPGTSSGGSGFTGMASLQVAGQPFNVTVNSVDDYWNVVSATDTVDLSASDGAASFTPASAALVAGTKGFSVTLNTAGAQTITATNSTDGSKTAATGSVTVAIADFRTQASGLWNSTNTWEVSLDGGAWNPAFLTPSAANTTNILVQSGHTVTVAAAVAVDDCVVQAGGTVTVSNATLTLSGTGLDVFGVLRIADNASSLISGATTSSLKFENGGKYSSQLHTATPIPTATWATNSTCEIAPASAGAQPPTNLGQTFGNFTWNWPSQNNSVNFAGALSNVFGNVSISSSSVVRLFNAVGGNVSDAVNVENVGGDFTVAGGTVFTFGTAVNNATNTLNVGGNFTVASGAVFNCPNTGTNSLSVVAFTGTGVQTFNNAGIITNSGTSQAGPASQLWSVNSGATVLLTSLLPLNVTTINPPSRLVVNGALNLTTSGSVTGGSVTIGVGGTLLGNGTITSPTTVNTGTVSPGASVGKLTVGNLTLDSTSTNYFEFDVAGATNDLLVVNGALNPGGSRIVINITGGTLASGTYRLIDYTGAKTGTFNASVTVTGSAAAEVRLSESISGQINLVVNTAPVANSDSLSRGSGISMKIPVASLLTNDTDIDDDTPLFVGTAATTTNSAAISNDGTYIYVPAATVNDAFTYTIHDNHGGTNTGTVLITIVGTSGQQSTTVSVTPSNATAVFFGIPGQFYTVQRATNVTFDAGVSNFPSAAAPSNGSFSVTDDFSDLGTPPGSAYYRLLAHVNINLEPIASMNTKHNWILPVVAALVMAGSAARATLYSVTFEDGFDGGTTIADGNVTGWTDSREISDIVGNDEIVSVAVRLDLSGGYNGDLYGYLVLTDTDTHTSLGFSLLLNQVGTGTPDEPMFTFGYSDSGLNVSLSDTGANGNIHNYQDVVGYAGLISTGGAFQTDGGDLSDFIGQAGNNTWTLFLADLSTGSVMGVNNWGLDIQVVPEPTTWAVIIFGVVAGAFEGRRRWNFSKEATGKH